MNINRVILHIDFNSYFATVEQQANPRLRGKPIGVSGGDRTKRTVIGAASIEAKKFGVKTGMQIWEARKLCPEIILVPGDSEKYLECTKRFLNILKDYSPFLEVFSIDEVFLQVNSNIKARNSKQIQNNNFQMFQTLEFRKLDIVSDLDIRNSNFYAEVMNIALDIKKRIRDQIGEWISCSIGISYNKLIAKLAGSLIKPDGLVIIPNPQIAMDILDAQPLDEICGIGYRIKSRLNKMGIFNFRQLRQVPKDILLFEFKSYGEFLYNAARGEDDRAVMPFYEKEEVKSVGHRHTLNHDTDDLIEVKQTMLKLTELIARKLRSKKLVGKTVSCWFRYAIDYTNYNWGGPKPHFEGDGMQVTIPFTNDGLEIFKAGWRSFLEMWDGHSIRMVGVSISNLKPTKPENLSLLEEIHRTKVITGALDKINDRYGEFTLKRGILLGTPNIRRMPNSFLADRRFRI